MNNPMKNDESRKKMILSLTGKKQSEETKRKRSESLKEYYKNNPEKKKERVKKLHEKYTKKISGTGWRKIREKHLEENSNCKKCGMSRDEHRKIYNKDIEVHHLNHKGRNMKSHKLFDNKKNNLMTLCKKCHAIESSNHRWKYE